MRLSYGVCVKLTVACGMEASVLGPERPEDSEASQLGSRVPVHFEQLPQRLR